MSKLSIIIPCYYNEKNIKPTTTRLIDLENNYPDDLEIEYILVDDGSKDNTLEELLFFKEKYKSRVRVIKLSGNFGSYNAIIAGMQYATGDCNVVISADLQDPPELIKEMYDYWLKGIKLVLANRSDRKDGYLDKIFSRWYHKIIKRYALPTIPNGGFDFCLFDSDLKNEVLKMNEKNTNTLFLLVWMKYNFVTIPYVRNERTIGVSKWTFEKKIKLLIDSFVSFSFFPIRMISTIGFALGFGAILYSLSILYFKISGKIEMQGWSSIMLVFLFVSSFQMISLGIIGEYLWRTLDAARNRPNYIIDKIY
jgi:dolichol-phosphate mannosyltransferase